MGHWPIDRREEEEDVGGLVPHVDPLLFALRVVEGDQLRIPGDLERADRVEGDRRVVPRDGAVLERDVDP